ncbi:MAG: UvrB/UvrC motif-containing protein [Verrucomicrobiales bacterium]
MNFDISDLLNSWEFQAGQIIVRRFLGQDGKEKIQLRVDLGLLQMNAVGRPDGKQPSGFETAYDYQLDRLNKSRKKGEPFKLTPEECSVLQQEAIQFHHRYICLFQLKDFNAVIRDTERNMAVFDFVEEYSESPEMLLGFQQNRPQLIMMHVRAKATLALETNDYETATQVVEDGLTILREIYGRMDRPDLLESSGEIYSLEMFLTEIRSTKPLSERERLQKALNDAVEREDFERAAKYRDQIKGLKDNV